MTRLRGRAKRGQRLNMHAPFGHWRTQTFVAGLRCYGLTAPWVLDGPMNRRAFETYIETQLAPTLNKGDVVIMDNLSSHKSPRTAEAVRDQGAWHLFLPPYSPDLNPIEMAFSKLKELLRKHNARTIDNSVARHRRYLRPVHSNGMHELLCRSRIWTRPQMNVRCSNGCILEVGKKKGNEQSVCQVDEEGTHQGHDDERQMRGPKALGHRRHVRNCGRSRA